MIISSVGPWGRCGTPPVPSPMHHPHRSRHQWRRPKVQSDRGKSDPPQATSSRPRARAPGTACGSAPCSRFRPGQSARSASSSLALGPSRGVGATRRSRGWYSRHRLLQRTEHGHGPGTSSEPEGPSEQEAGAGRKRPGHHHLTGRIAHPPLQSMMPSGVPD